MALKIEPYDYLIWVMLLLVTLHSVSIAIYLFEWLKAKFDEDESKKKPKYAFQYINDDVTIQVRFSFFNFVENSILKYVMVLFF
jgi:hypothetical protein